MDEQMSLEERIAKFFHTTYEDLAPQYQYTTRKESAVPWSEVPENNKQLMIAVSREVVKVFGLDAAIAEQTGLWLTTANTADILVFWQNQILLIKRRSDPYKDRWAFPGGFFEPEKDLCLEVTAERELCEETGIQRNGFTQMMQVGTYSKRGRDPRGTVITTAFHTNIIDHRYDGWLKAGDDAKEAAWFPLDDLPLPLAFDHEEILADALE